MKSLYNLYWERFDIPLICRGYWCAAPRRYIFLDSCRRDRMNCLPISYGIVE